MRAITEYFRKRFCKHCDQPYTAEGIELIRHEPGVIVVRVVCCACSTPLGIALVGMNTPSQLGTCQHGRPGTNTPQPARKWILPGEWTKRDACRLGENPPISYDDVLAAHEFFDALGDDWAKHLPRIRPKTA
jgi:hypothetical protein